MAKSPPGGKFRISPIDSQGRTIDPEVLAVAYQIGERALGFAEKALGDPAVAISVLEETAGAVSRVVNAQRQHRGTGVQNLGGYLFSAFVRRVNRLKRRELRVAESLSNESLTSQEYPDRLEKELLITELLAQCDPVTREMFRRRSHGYDWDSIGKKFGISGHAAESRFSQAMKRLKKRLGL
jgi:DNA-directed RNA polymerase specialized sigma24 family protein